MQKLKQILLLFAVLGHIIGIALLFFSVQAALWFYGVYVIALVLIFIILIIERKKEKEEDDRNDYRNY